MENTDLENWEKAQEYSIRLDHLGKIIDFLDEDTRRENTAEERIRQKMVQVLHHEFKYPRKLLAMERWIKIGVERKRIDIAVFTTPEANAANDQGQITIVGETKSPLFSDSDGQVISYISSTSS